LLPTRISIHTDNFVIGNLGGKRRVDYTVISSGVRFAKLLESACSPFKIMISEESMKLLDHFQREAGSTNKIHLSVNPGSKLMPAYEFNPYFSSPENLVALEKNIWKILGRFPLQKRIRVTPIDRIILKMPKVQFNISEFSFDGMSGCSMDFIAKGSLLNTRIVTSDESFNKSLSSFLIDEIEIEVKWCRFSKGVYRHGFKINGLNERQKKFLFNGFLSLFKKEELRVIFNSANEYMELRKA
ncbi:MAG: hypothetical protein HQK54_06715, partial [Oligoflexales bacterium]|nr:hypothetical protein [Oligoflexales bacterium]